MLKRNRKQNYKPDSDNNLSKVPVESNKSLDKKNRQISYSDNLPENLLIFY